MMLDATREGAIFLLLYGIIPVWIAAGFADYCCHRAARIEKTSGTSESALHLVQFGLIGVPILLGLFLRINAGLLLFFMLCILLHHAVAYFDIRRAADTRAVAPPEQMVHSFLEIAPLAALALIAALHWPQTLALFASGAEPARFAPEFAPLPAPYIALVLGAAGLFNLVPYLEEFVRCVRHARSAA